MITYYLYLNYILKVYTNKTALIFLFNPYKLNNYDDGWKTIFTTWIFISTKTPTNRFIRATTTKAQYQETESVTALEVSKCLLGSHGELL